MEDAVQDLDHDPKGDKEAGIGVPWPNAGNVAPAAEQNEHHVDDDEEDEGTVGRDVIDPPNEREYVVQFKDSFFQGMCGLKNDERCE